MEAPRVKNTPRWADEPDDAPFPDPPDYGPPKYVPPQKRPIPRRPLEKEKKPK
jgi:hypothetical protein